jgi:hypothetical protein
MATCEYCKTEETEVYDNGVAVCSRCVTIRQAKVQVSLPPGESVDVQAILVDAIFRATARSDAAALKFHAAIREIPSWPPQPDGTLYLRNVGYELAAARSEIMKAHNELIDYLEHGIAPEDLKRTG